MSIDLFGGVLPPVVSPQKALMQRAADVLLGEVPPPPGGLWIGSGDEPVARELVRQGRARLVWVPEPGVYELRRVAT